MGLSLFARVVRHIDSICAGLLLATSPICTPVFEKWLVRRHLSQSDLQTPTFFTVYVHLVVSYNHTTFFLSFTFISSIASDYLNPGQSKFS